MKHTAETTNLPPNLPKVTVPWGRKKDLPQHLRDRVYETCRRGDKANCINSNLVRAFADFQGRITRHIKTYKGDLHWSEQIGDQWCMFVAPLSAKYATLIDGFDSYHQNFRAPISCPMGPVRFVGFCKPRRDSPEVMHSRRARMNARISEGKLVPGSRFREPQLPYVQAATGT